MSARAGYWTVRGITPAGRTARFGRAGYARAAALAAALRRDNDYARVIGPRFGGTTA